MPLHMFSGLFVVRVLVGLVLRGVLEMMKSEGRV